jgi:DNA modification methylase
MHAKNNIGSYLNKVFLKDIMELLRELPDKCVDMVYGDPDYNVGIRYGDKSYTRNFNEYIEWYIELARQSLRVLKDTGNMFLMNYPKQNAYLRVKYLDGVCYEVLDYVWVYNTNVGHSPSRFTTAHRSILHCRKTSRSKFYKDNVAVPYKNPTDKRILHNLANGSKGRMPYDWLYFDLVKNVSKEKTFHACQIPQRLSEALIKSCTVPKDIVLILFGGSGSEIEVCKFLGRQFISAEIDERYYEIILDRLRKGKIDQKYRLKMKRGEAKTDELQLTFLDNY